MPLPATGESSAIMSDRLVDAYNPETLLAEIDRLREEILRLEHRMQTLDRLAHEDFLIELPNRRGFMRQLDQQIARVDRYQHSGAMLFVDIDGLKMINDSFGHKAGDQALIQVAKFLMKGVRKSDLVARLGGDEFGVLLDNADEDMAADTAARLTRQIADAEFCYEGTCLPLSVAIGVAMIEPGDSAEDIMARADRAMYEEKAAA